MDEETHPVGSWAWTGLCDACVICHAVTDHLEAHYRWHEQNGEDTPTIYTEED